jgi:hypothetical protein
VKHEGVEHVMRLFLQHYSSEMAPNMLKSDGINFNAIELDLIKEHARLSEVICDEEALDAGH